MRKLLVATAALAALVGTPAFAADMAAPVYKAPTPPPPPPCVWCGFYIGLNGGYGWGTDPVSFSPANAAAVVYFTGGAVPGTITTSPQGGLFGGQIGYNYQWSSFVAGVETDFDWANIRGNGAVGTAAPGFVPFTTSATQKLTSLGTFRGRIGVAADRALFYATGGLAYGRTQLNTSVITPTVACGPIGVCAAAASTQWQTGWSAGAGVEYAFISGWSAKVEYLHYDLGTHTQSQFDPNDAAPIPVFNSSATFRGNIIRGGVNYRFGGL
jgi:outer membrane immunogenic protein